MGLLLMCCSLVVPSSLFFLLYHIVAPVYYSPPHSYLHPDGQPERDLRRSFGVRFFLRVVEEIAPEEVPCSTSWADVEKFDCSRRLARLL